MLNKRTHRLAADRSKVNQVTSRPGLNDSMVTVLVRMEVLKSARIGANQTRVIAVSNFRN